MKPALFAFAAAVALGLAGAAAAHPHPKTFSPAPDAVLSASPKEIRIGFSEALVAAFSGLELADQAGRKADLGPSRVDGAAKSELSAAVKTPLPAGTYTVTWHAVAADTHHVTSHYSFQVRP
jgi:methionine-rich copper-binding protein CopC